MAGITCCIYIIQFFFYFFTYKHLFETWRNKKYQYGKYGSTIKFLWLLLNLMATFVMSMLFFPSRTLFSVLIVFYIITFITFTILFYRLLIILNIADFEREYQYNMKGRDKASTQKNMESALQGWIENKGFVERNITITTLAKQLGTNRTYLSNHINENFGENFNTWVNQLRIKEAQVLLEENNRSLHEIADSVGFTDLPHFSRTFKSVTGQSPSAWRKQSGKSE
jgi:AraC-like DNA-binding protein